MRLSLPELAKPLSSVRAECGSWPHWSRDGRRSMNLLDDPALRRVGLGHLAGGDSPRGSPWKDCGVLPAEQGPKLPDEYGQMLLQNFPCDVGVDRTVAVDELIAKADDF